MNFEITKQVIAAIIRWLLVGIALKLVEAGIIDQTTAEAWLGETTAVLLGIAILAVTLGWKWLNAKYNILAVIAAVQTDPPADTPREIAAAVKQVKMDVKADNYIATM